MKQTKMYENSNFRSTMKSTVSYNGRMRSCNLLSTVCLRTWPTQRCLCNHNTPSSSIPITFPLQLPFSQSCLCHWCHCLRIHNHSLELYLCCFVAPWTRLRIRPRSWGLDATTRSHPSIIRVWSLVFTVTVPRAPLMGPVALKTPP